MTVEIVRGVRVYGGTGRDRNNRDSEATMRLNAGLHATSLARSGCDVTATFSRTDRGVPGSYDSYYVSVGRGLGSRVYLSADYTSSLAVVRFAQGEGVMIETRPQTRRLSASALINVTATMSLLATFDRTDDGSTIEDRLLAGISYRIQ